MRVSLISTQMRYFLAVAQAGSISAAAGQLHVAASAVSRQLAKLEDALGVALFERRQRGMRPTAAGARLAAHLRSTADDAERVIGEVQGLAHRSRPQLRLACTEGFAAGFMPAVIARFREVQPDAQVRLHVAAPDEVSALLLRAQVDLALKYCVAPEPGTQVQHGTLAPVFAFMKADHPLARRRTLRVADVVRHPLVLGAKGVTGRQLFDMSCSLQGLRYEAAVVSNFSSALLPLVRGRDIVLAGYLTAAHLVADATLVAVPFADGELQQRRLQLLSLEGRALSPTVQAFVRCLAATMQASATGPAPSADAPSPGASASVPRARARAAATPAPARSSAARRAGKAPARRVSSRRGRTATARQPAA